MYMLTRQKNFQQICSSVKYIFKFKTRKTLCYDIIHISLEHSMFIARVKYNIFKNRNYLPKTILTYSIMYSQCFPVCKLRTVTVKCMLCSLTSSIGYVLQQRDVRAVCHAVTLSYQSFFYHLVPVYNYHPFLAHS